MVARSNLEALNLLRGYSTTAFSVNRNASRDCVAVPTTQTKVGTALANLCLLCATLSPKGAYFLLRNIRMSRPDLIWLDSSLFGILIPLIRLISRKSKIVCYFHNIETPIVKAYAKKQPYYWISYLATWINEYLSINKSDVLIAIQQTDETILRSKNPSAVTWHIPASIKDEFQVDQGREVTSISEIPFALFVGSDFPPNIEALSFLNSKIAPNLIGKKIIAVGNGLNKYAAQFKNLDIHGRVENIAEYYRQAHVVVAPIFSGGGMKVKIAEALMFNKVVFASSFASIGYEQVSGDAIVRIDDEESMINSIRNYDPTKSTEARKFYIELFSQKAIQKKIVQIIEIIDATR